MNKMHVRSTSRVIDSLVLLGLLGVGLIGHSVLARLPARHVDGAQALDHVRRQVAFGPRVPGTEAHSQTRTWISQQLESLGWFVQEQEFETTLPLTGKSVTACNIYALPLEGGPSSPTLMLSAHWDTRPFADEGGTRHAAMDGANDGGSGVAVLLEVARALQNDPMRDQVVLAFWDAEDAGTAGDQRSWAKGSQYAAEHPPVWIDSVVLGINLDMVGSHDVLYQPESQSLAAAPDAIRSLWMLGIVMAPDLFDTSRTFQIMDDHVPWIEAGLPFIDLIGWPYEHWHTTEDDLSAISSESLQQTGNVVLEYLRSQSWPDHGREPGALGHAPRH